MKNDSGGDAAAAEPGQTYHSCMTDDRQEYIAIMLLVVFGLYSYCLRAGEIQ